MPVRKPRRPSLSHLALPLALAGLGCGDAGRPAAEEERETRQGPTETVQQAAVVPEYTLAAHQTHNKWSRTIPPVLRVPPGAVIEAYTEEASDGQLSSESTAEEFTRISFDPIHPLTGPVYVEGASPGDVLAVTLLEIELGEWGWTGVFPGFGFLAERFREPFLRTWRFEAGATEVEFAPGVFVPLRPFPGVMGVAPDTDSLLSTIPPRSNGGNMDDRDLVQGTTVYFPVFVEGALFSIGDPHAAQGDGEVGGTAVEAPLRIVYRVEVIEGGRHLPSPQYENEEFYAVTGYGETIDQATRRATLAMIDYLVRQHGLDPTEAYVLASVAAHLKIAETVDVPHMLVTMRIPRDVLPGPAGLEAAQAG